MSADDERAGTDADATAPTETDTGTDADTVAGPNGRPARPVAARRANAAASAASRARRIGGATRPGPTRPSTSGVTTGSTPDAAVTAAVTTDTDTVQPSETSTEPSTKRTRPVRLRKTPAAAPAAAAAPADADPGAEHPGAENPDTENPNDGPARPARWRSLPPWARWVPAAVLGALAVAMAVVLVVAADGVWFDKPATQSVREKVLAAAKTCTALTNEYSYKTIPKDEARGATCTTGAQTGKYRSAMVKIVKPSAVKLQASQAVQINAAGIESVSESGTTWKVVLFGQTKITQKGESPRIDPFSAVTTMHYTGGKWLISAISLITSPSS